MTEVGKDKDGRPLTDRRSRSYGHQPFMGRGEGKPHPRAANLKARQEAFDALPATRAHGRKRPGSVKKS